MLRERLTRSFAALALLLLAQSASAATGWLHTSGNRFYTESNEVWVGVGANMHDTRSCNACTWGPPDVGEVKRRIDMLVDDWGANFIRLDLESYGSSGVLSEAAYLADVREIVDHIGTKPGVYVLLSLWIDPSFTDLGWPTAATRDVWRKLAETFRNHPYVMYGLVNEPQHNYDGAHNATVWNAMNDAVLAIRDVEDSYGTPRHIVAVQGVGGWSRFLGYYVNNPITAGGGQNVAYEVHVYDPESTFAERFENPSLTLPVIIGEYGPMHGMSMQDCSILQQRAFDLKVPHLAWTFHMRCPPNLIVDNSGGSCGIGMNLEPTSWGVLFKNHIASVKTYLDSINTDAGGAGASGGGGTSGGGTSGGDTAGGDTAGGSSGGDSMGQYNPSFSLGANNNEWWIEAYADADTAFVEMQSGARVALANTDWGSFAANTNVPRGTLIRLHFTLATASASSTWFNYLTQVPVLDTAPSEPAPGSAPVEPAPVDPVVVEPVPTDPVVVQPVPAAPVDPVDPPPATSWEPELTLSPNVNEWWVEVYSNADSVEAEVDDGRVLSLDPTSWGSFSASAFVQQDRGVRFHLTRGDDTVTTSWFAWLSGEPSLEGNAPPPRVTYDPHLSLSGRASEWWPALTADADTVVGQVASSGELFSFSKRRSTFVSNLRPIRRGTSIRLFFTKGGSKAETGYFRYLVDEPALQ